MLVMGHSLPWWILLGLMAGMLAKAIVPGTSREPRGCFSTMFLGIAGSLLVGFIVHARHGTFFGSLIGATIGAVLLIILARKLWD